MINIKYVIFIIFFLKKIFKATWFFFTLLKNWELKYFFFLSIIIYIVFCTSKLNSPILGFVFLIFNNYGIKIYIYYLLLPFRKLLTRENIHIYPSRKFTILKCYFLMFNRIHNMIHNVTMTAIVNLMKTYSLSSF